MTCLQNKTEMSSRGKQLSFLLACFLAPATIAGLSLNNCGGSSNDKTAEVVRGETSSFTCTLTSAESTHTLEWIVNTGTDQTVGTCPPPSNGDRCNPKLKQAYFTPRRTESTRSEMTVDPTKANLPTEVESGTLVCKDQNNSEQDSCIMDYITRASGMCSVRVDTNTTPWTVKGDCNITQGNSSRSRYSCQWFHKKDEETEVMITSLMPMTSITLPTGSAKCLVSQPLPDQDGRYTYRVMFLPGRQFFAAGTVDISRPSTPTVTCTPPGRVTENNTVTCTCTTDNVGQPAGRLRWLRGSSDVIASSAQGRNRLELSQTLNRSDDGVQFRCRLDWSNMPVTSTVYNASVGYPPSTSELTISPSSPSRPVTVSENSTVSFTCNATGGNPPSTMTLSYVTSTLRSGPSPLTFDLPAVARCEHSGVYTCTGSNGYGQAVIDTASLHVLCSPRSASPITALNFIDKKVGTSFSVTAYPLSTLTFSYLGRSKNTTSSPKNLPDSITMDGSCEATSGIVHQSTCTITVYNVTSDEAAGIYQVNVSNTQGMTNAMFEVKYRAPVPPSEEPSSGNAAVIGGVVGAVVVAVIIAAVVFVVWKRRKGSDKEHSRSTAAGRPKNGQGRNSYREMDEPGLANADPEAPSRPLSFAPMAVYAQVDKNQKNSKAAAAPGANGGQPADVYAQVDTTKKSNQGAAAPETEVNGGHPVDVYAVVEKTKKKQASGAKPKTGAKAAAKPKKEKKKKDKRNESAHVYGNVKEIKQDKGAKAKEEKSSGKMVNPEGLIYTAVEFSQPPKSGKPAPKKPEEEPVVYSAVDFKRSPPAP